jgi:hypothetical protein
MWRCISVNIARACAILLVALSIQPAASGSEEHEVGIPCHREIAEVARSTGYDGPLTLLRNDTQSLALDPTRVSSLLFYLIEKGGAYIDEDGLKVHALPNLHTAPMRVFVDSRSCQVFRMLGFGGENDYSQLARHIQHRVTKVEVPYIMKNYLELTYRPNGRVINNHYEAQQFIESMFYSRVGEEEQVACCRRWFKKNYGKLHGKITEPQVSETEDGFRIAVSFGVPPGIDAARPEIELRALVIDVGTLGETEIRSEDVLMSFNSNQCR